MLASGADDGKVYVWDNSKCGEEQARKDYEDGPPDPPPLKSIVVALFY